MGNWFRNVATSLVKRSRDELFQQARPTVEPLETRCLLNNQSFVMAAYQTLLNRPADPGGLSFFTNLLNNNQATRLQVAEDLVSRAAQEGEQLAEILRQLQGIIQALAPDREDHHST